MTATRIAMWSGPRNLSTALMYSFASRSDCSVWDEPFYAAYLKISNVKHPMADEVMAAYETDYEEVTKRCKGPVPKSRDVFFLKLMAHHMVEGTPLDWAKDFVNVHLIRHPSRVINSYIRSRGKASLNDIGFNEQLRIYESVGGIVLDTSDIRRNPVRAIKSLCQHIGITFEESMLRWAPGGLPEDGIWARHWYKSVHKSEGFQGPEGKVTELDDDALDLMVEAMPAYEKLKAQAIKV